VTDTEFRGWFEITIEKMAPSSLPAHERAVCTCGVIVSYVDKHIDFHRMLGHICVDNRGE
jgi:hypothetical protein